jgi:hypothetical protein
MPAVSEEILYNTHGLAAYSIYLELTCENDSKRFNPEEGYIQAAQEEWDKLDSAAVDKSIDNMNKRVQQVLKKR